AGKPGGDSFDDRPSALRRIWQLDGRPADAGVDRCRRRRAAENVTPVRRRHARIRLRPGPRAARKQSRHLHACTLRGGEKKGWTVISMKNDWKRIFAF